MDWEQVQRRIEAHVKVGTDLNTPASTYRFVEVVELPINSTRYGYDNETGFVRSHWSVQQDQDSMEDA